MGTRTIEVTDEEYEMLIKARTEIQRKGDKDDALKGMAVGAVAGAGAMLVLQMLLEEDVEVVEAIRQHVMGNEKADFVIKGDSHYIMK